MSLSSKPMHAEIEAVLGAEYDQVLFERLRSVIVAAGGRISESSYGMGGSQEVFTYDFVLPSGKLVLVAETYAGLSIQGPNALVEEVSNAVRSA
jgi:hypothetical protein